MLRADARADYLGVGPVYAQQTGLTRRRSASRISRADATRDEARRRHRRAQPCRATARRCRGRRAGLAVVSAIVAVDDVEKAGNGAFADPWLADRR